MKKMLGISLVAVLTAVPMMANAATKVGAGSADAFATTSYVNGAYNDLVDEINTKQDQLKSGAVNGANVSPVVKTAIATGIEEDQASNTSLLTEKAVYDAIGVAKNAAISAANSADTLINNKIGNAEVSVRNETTVVGALNKLSTDLGTAENEITKLKAGENVEGSIDYKIKQKITQVNSATDDLGTRVTSNKNAIDGIKARQISYVTTWGDEANSTVTKTIDELPSAE